MPRALSFRAEAEEAEEAADGEGVMPSTTSTTDASRGAQ